MASLGCGINSILDRIENIKAILRKYSIVSNAIGNWAPTQGFMVSINIPFAEFFKGIGDAAAATSLYKAIQDAYNIAKTGIEYIKAVQAAVQEIQKDFGDVVSNLSGILQDIQDLTILDIQVLELDLAKLGFNPGEIITRLKNGEDLEQVLGDAKDKLSTTSAALIDKISKPLSISFDLTCQKLPNVVMLEVGNVKTPVILPEPPQSQSPGLAKKQEVPVVTTKTPNDQVGGVKPWDPAGTQSNVEKYFANAKDSKYNFAYFAKNGMGTSKSNIDRDWNKVSSTLSSKLGIPSTTLLKYIEINYDAIGYFIAAPLVEKYPKVKFTSGWRHTLGVSRLHNRDPNAVSPHCYGAAFDFQFPDEYWKSYYDNPMTWLLLRLQTLRVGPTTSRLGRYQLIRESNPGDKYSQMVWHVGAVYAPIRNNNFNGSNLIIEQKPRLTE